MADADSCTSSTDSAPSEGPALYPPCFPSPEEFAVWQLFARKSLVDPSRYCLDCTPAFQEKALRHGLCRHPEVVFMEYATKELWGEREIEILGMRLDEFRLNERRN